MGANIKVTSGPVIEKSGDLAAILTSLQEGDVLFIDEIHRLNHVVEEILYPAMEDFQLDLVIGQGPGAKSVKMDLPHFTLVGATTRTGLLTPPFGLLVYTVRGAVTDPTATLGKIFAGSTPYFLLILLAALIVLFVPGLANWLPDYML